MDFNDRQYATAVINFFWGAGTTTPEGVNEAAVLATYEALEQANVCSDSMDLVPRPAFGRVNIKYALKQLAGIGKRIMQGDDNIYNSCRAVVGVRYKSKIVMALAGV
ncbi:hypothetical protein [Halopseudomonas salegens]|uniref:Uncharacterized protein n=1 Tax=Halopseudomonas salegens TaxID=1434072 RepID=A0A1H2G8M2_9GAMM|nr:hypothetical protein [Halopseudomonas salegens]SDU15963.1 hypothetical protein SAMN05216210_2122 [Halopseudomonas salegens]